MKTRFPPSPTGNLHLGGLRTALYSWLLARKHKGKFMLRIEDTDTARSEAKYTQSIIDAMNWLQLRIDEGPYFQSERIAFYQETVQQLLAEGKAYPCYCSKERLAKLREEQIAARQKPRYDGYCYDAQHVHGKPLNDKPYVIRFRNPQVGTVVFNDLIHGPIHTANAELDDMVLIRSDAMPTYNLCVVVDDLAMGVTHVIRGDDHINNTPRQINLYHALDRKPPEFGHLGMILGADGQRLSKRHGALSVLAYHEQGYLPEALLSYLARLGWSHGDQEIFSLAELIHHFDLRNVHKSAATFDPQKLLWINHEFIKKAAPEDLAVQLKDFLRQIIDDQAIQRHQQSGYLYKAIQLVQERSKTLVELADNLSYFVQDRITYVPEAAKKHLRPVAEVPLQQFSSRASALSADDWSEDKIKALLEQVITELEIGMGKLGQPLRVALSGRAQAPAVNAMIALLGKEQTLSRIEQALVFIKQRIAQD